MAWVTEEEYQAAKQVRAYEYLQTYQPGRLKKTRTRNEWQLQDHDSFKINEITSKWHWKSRDIGGMSALRFLMQVDGMEYLIEGHAEQVGIPVRFAATKTVVLSAWMRLQEKCFLIIKNMS